MELLRLSLPELLVEPLSGVSTLEGAVLLLSTVRGVRTFSVLSPVLGVGTFSVLSEVREALTFSLACGTFLFVELLLVSLTLSL